MLLACRSGRLCVYSLPVSSLCGGLGSCGLLLSTGSRQTLHVEAHRFLRCCCGLQDLHQSLSEFLVGLTQNVSESSKMVMSLTSWLLKISVVWRAERFGVIMTPASIESTLASAGKNFFYIMWSTNTNKQLIMKVQLNTKLKKLRQFYFVEHLSTNLIFTGDRAYSFSPYLSASWSEDSPSSCDDDLPPPASFILVPPGSSSSSASSGVSPLCFKACTGRRENTDSSPVIAKLEPDKQTPENSGQQTTAWLCLWPSVKVYSNKCSEAHVHTLPLYEHTHTNTKTHFNSLGAERNTSIFVLLWQQVHLRHNTGWSDSPTYWMTSRNTSISLHSQTGCAVQWLLMSETDTDLSQTITFSDSFLSNRQHKMLNTDRSD